MVQGQTQDEDLGLKGATEMKASGSLLRGLRRKDRLGSTWKGGVHVH